MLDWVVAVNQAQLSWCRIFLYYYFKFSKFFTINKFVQELFLRFIVWILRELYTTCIIYVHIYFVFVTFFINLVLFLWIPTTVRRTCRKWKMYSKTQCTFRIHFRIHLLSTLPLNQNLWFVDRDNDIEFLSFVSMPNFISARTSYTTID